MIDDTVEHDEHARRLTRIVDGQRCVLDYSLDHEVMTIVRTYVPPPVEGRGIAAELTRAALQFARRRHWRVRATCSYAVAYLRKHQHQFGDLIAAVCAFALAIHPWMPP